MPPLGLADVSRSAAAAVGVPGFADTLGIGECQQVVVLLVDGLGWNILRAEPALAPHLLEIADAPIRAAFPTTTPVGLGTFGTGLPPGVHGLVGASFWLPESDQVLSPLHWGDDPLPVAVQPEPTVFEQAVRAGVVVTSVSPAAYAHSGLTRAALRGPAYRPSEDLPSRVSEVAMILARGQRSFTYVYWFELDRIGHEFGVDSDEWRAALVRVDDLFARLLAVLPADAALVVTADHGMVDCPEDQRIQLEDDPRLMSGVTTIAGEPRARHVYVHPGAESDVTDAWTAILEGRARVLSRKQVVESGLMGDVDPSLSARLGDVMAVSSGASMLASRVDSRVSRLLGQHGALTDDEVLIPAIVRRGS